MAKIKTKTFPRGTHFDDRKWTNSSPIERMPVPQDVYIALSQHVGAPAKPVVEAGETVKEGQLIAEASGNVSANIFSSVSGQVVGIETRKNNQGVASSYVHIRCDGSEARQELSPMQDVTRQSIIARIREAGIVGMGGAGFPTAVKVEAEHIDTLIINAAECEPYLTCDHRLMLEKTEEVVKGIKLLAVACGAERIVVGIEENKPDAIEKLSAFDGICVEVLKKKYPQGAEKQLIYATTGRVVPVKGLPKDVNVIVNNVATAYAVYEAVECNKPLYERVMTVSGFGVNQPKNLLVKVGTPYKDVLAYCGGVKEDAVKLIAGGPMMGVALKDDSGVTAKTDSGLLALQKGEASVSNPTACINCCKCAKVCPMNLMPMYIDFYALAGDVDGAVKYGAENCIECGCCAYVCPAKRAIVQSVKITKAKLRGRK